MSSTPSSLDYPKMNMPLPIAIVLAFMLLIGVALLFHIGIMCSDSLKINVSKDKLNPARWFRNKYRFYVANEVLPTLEPKEKESPTVGPDPVSPVLPKCPKLDGAEKGKNLMFRFRAPTMTPDSAVEITISSLPV
jgi:hypothetical protein